MRSSEDAFVDRLFDRAPSITGAPFLVARAPRAYLDLNRAPDELDPALVAGCAAGPAQSAHRQSGLGVVPRVSWPGGGPSIAAS